MSAKPGPSILFVYFTYTKQTLKVVEAMSEVFERRGCDVHRAVIEFDEPRYQSHEPLLGAVVQVALEQPALGLPGLDDARGRCPQLALELAVLDREELGRRRGADELGVGGQGLVDIHRGDGVAVSLDGHPGAAAIPSGWRDLGAVGFAELARRWIPEAEPQRRIIERAGDQRAPCTRRLRRWRPGSCCESGRVCARGLTPPRSLRGSGQRPLRLARSRPKRAENAHKRGRHAAPQTSTNLLQKAKIRGGRPPGSHPGGRGFESP